MYLYYILKRNLHAFRTKEVLVSSVQLSFGNSLCEKILVFVCCEFRIRIRIREFWNK